jgi:hypothetical protein
MSVGLESIAFIGKLTQGDQMGFMKKQRPLGPSIFSNNYFLVHHPVNWDDPHVTAPAMASDFSVTLQLQLQT